MWLKELREVYEKAILGNVGKHIILSPYSSAFLIDQKIAQKKTFANTVDVARYEPLRLVKKKNRHTRRKTWCSSEYDALGEFCGSYTSLQYSGHRQFVKYLLMLNLFRSRLPKFKSRMLLNGFRAFFKRLRCLSASFLIKLNVSILFEHNEHPIYYGDDNIRPVSRSSFVPLSYWPCVVSKI